jgi:protein transport protein SEC61 subunit alpha
LFIATNVCEVILWQSFSPIRIEQGTEFEGAVIAFLHFLWTKENKLNALYLGLFRSNAANLMNLFTTIIVLLIVIYF